MENNPTGYVSVIGANLIEPILELVQKLEAKPIIEPNEVQTGPYENGFSCAIITLSLFLLESAFNRTKYIRGDNNDKSDLVQYFSKLFSDVELAKDIDEIIAVRDAIVHNHLWEANVFWDNDLSLKFSGRPKLLEVYGNRRQRRVMNINTRLSRRLELNLFPPRIWRRDAYITLGTVYRILAKLEEIDQNYFTITYLDFMFSDQLQTLGQILDILPYLSKVG
jgi:hypothetical protein